MWKHQFWCYQELHFLVVLGPWPHMTRQHCWRFSFLLGGTPSKKGYKNEHSTKLLLMVQKSGDHQLRLVVYPIIYKVYTSQVVQDFFHQLYWWLSVPFRLDIFIIFGCSNCGLFGWFVLLLVNLFHGNWIGHTPQCHPIPNLPGNSRPYEGFIKYHDPSMTVRRFAKRLHLEAAVPPIQLEKASEGREGIASSMLHRFHGCLYRYIYKVFIHPEM